MQYQSKVAYSVCLHDTRLKVKGKPCNDWQRQRRDMGMKASLFEIRGKVMRQTQFWSILNVARECDRFMQEAGCS